MYVSSQFYLFFKSVITKEIKRKKNRDGFFPEKCQQIDLKRKKKKTNELWDDQ